MDPLNVLAKFEVHSFTHSRDNSDWSFGWGANPNLGEGEAVGGRDGTIRKSCAVWVHEQCANIEGTIFVCENCDD